MTALTPDREHPSQQAARYALIFLGGAIGSLLRAMMLTQGPDSLGSLLWVNLSGSLGLGVLFAGLARVPASSATRSLRAFFGTGLLAGFTSYSALALGVTELAATSLLGALGYAIATVALGVCAAWLGHVLITRLFPFRGSRGAAS